MNAHTKNLLDRLENVSRTNDTQWEARCPAHDDRKSSLCVGVGDDGRTLLRCQAGCATESVVQAIKMTMADLFPPKVNGHSNNGHAQNGRTKKPTKFFSSWERAASDYYSDPKLERRREDQSWSYQNAKGQVVGVVLRWNFKDGSKEIRPVSLVNGVWIKRGMPEPRPLFNLPQVIAAENVVVCEGEPSVIAAQSILPTRFVATTSAHGAKAADTADWTPLAGKLVWLWPDNDSSGETYIDTIARLCSQFSSKPQIRILKVPGLPPGGDAADFVEAGGTRETLQPLIDSAQDWEAAEYIDSLFEDDPPIDVPRAEKESRCVVEADDDPHRLARVVMEEFPNLRYWRSEFFRYVDQRYRLMPSEEIGTQLTAIIKDEFDQLCKLELETWKPSEKQPEPPSPLKVTCSLANNVRQALESLCRLPHETELDSWLDGTAGSYVSVANGIVDINRAASGQSNCLLAHSPDWFSLVVLPYSFDAAATCPKWLAFLTKNLEGDAERIAILQEWFGLCLVADTSFQKFLLMIGEGANGKSVACAVLTALLGAANVSNVPLEGFGQRFQLMQTVGKLANIAAEIGEIDKVAEGHLKAFTSGDRMQFEQKYKDPIELAPTARLVLATNNLPRFADRSNGVWRRMILMPFRITISKTECVTGMDQPGWWLEQRELPGIFLWALVGLKRLREQRGFTKSAVCEEALTKYRGDCNPADTFLRENYREHQNGFVTTFEIYSKYRDWSLKHGYDKPLGDSKFGQEIVRTFPAAKRVKRGPRISRIYGYSGICDGAIEDEA